MSVHLLLVYTADAASQAESAAIIVLGLGKRVRLKALCTVLGAYCSLTGVSKKEHGGQHHTRDAVAMYNRIYSYEHMCGSAAELGMRAARKQLPCCLHGSCNADAVLRMLTTLAANGPRHCCLHCPATLEAHTRGVPRRRGWSPGAARSHRWYCMWRRHCRPGSSGRPRSRCGACVRSPAAPARSRAA